MAVIDETHDPKLRSWVESANQPGCDFPIQNLPLCVFSRDGEQEKRCGIGIGDYLFEVCRGDLAWYMKCSASERRKLRLEWSSKLRSGASAVHLHRQEDCTLHLPCAIGDYTDFYASLHHATNVGRMFRPENPLLPNYRHVPVGYHGRASSIVVSGTPVGRPCGQLGLGKFGRTEELDYEVEIGCFIGPGNALGKPIPIDQAQEHLVGFCIVNDWSARDIQRWEYQPLGPFLGKSFATSISPWVVTTEAMAPFWIAAEEHADEPLPYLQETRPGALDVVVETELQANGRTTGLSRGLLRELYWTFPQMVAHHTSNGCNLRTGDLLASGTISGPKRENRGCLLELTAKGSEPVSLVDGSVRTFLADGDTLRIRAFCEREGFVRIGFGSCAGTVVG